MARLGYSLPAAVALSLCGALSACGTGGTGGTGSEVAVTVPATGPVSAADRAWLVTTREDDLAHVQYGRLAERKGRTAAVRHAGRTLADVRAAFDEKVMHVAYALGIDLPRAQRSGQLALAGRLDKETGSRFDRAFVTAMAEEHQKAITRTEEQVRTGSSPTVNALARTELPVLRDHLAMVRRASPVG